MIKTKYDLLPEEWKQRVDELISLKKNKNKYNAKEVYAIHNYLFDKKEETSTCGSCLNRRYKAIIARIEEKVEEPDMIMATVEADVAVEEMPAVVAVEVSDESVKELLEENEAPVIEERGMSEVENLNAQLGFDVMPFVKQVKDNGIFMLSSDAKINKKLRAFKADIYELAKHMED